MAASFRSKQLPRPLAARPHAGANDTAKRGSALPGWIMVSVEDGDRDAVAALKSAEFARLVVPNRGLRICH